MTVSHGKEQQGSITERRSASALIEPTRMTCKWVTENVVSRAEMLARRERYYGQIAAITADLGSCVTLSTAEIIRRVNTLHPSPSPSYNGKRTKTIQRWLYW
jgi:hypothetical protein